MRSKKIFRTQLQIFKALEHSKNKCWIDSSCFSQSGHIKHICKPLLWICWSVGSLPWKNFQSIRVLEGEIDENQMNLPQSEGTLSSKKKVLVDLRVKRPNSSRIQLGIFCSSLTMIWLKTWGICFKDKGIFQSQPVQNWETVSGMLAPSDNPAIFAK